LNAAYERFLTTLPANAYVTVDETGWHLSTDPAEALSVEEQAGIDALHTWLSDKIDTIRLPDLLIAVDNTLNWTRHFISLGRRETRTADDVCQGVATIMAYGCNLGPDTMAQLVNGVSYDDIQRMTDWYLHEETLKSALADIVNAIADLDTTRVWGEAHSSSSDGQRFLFPRRVLQRTYSHRLGDFALEFYTFIADNYAPFYTVPIECTERDAPYVLDGLLYHESDIDPEEHYTDTHGYTEMNFCAFPMFGKRFCPRIRGLHRQWIYRIDPEREYGPLTPIVSHKKRTIHLEWITPHWDRMGQFFASFAAGQTTASVALKRLVACGPRNHFYRAVREAGRVFKTIFILDYLSDPYLRRRVRRGLLKGEHPRKAGRIGVGRVLYGAKFNHEFSLPAEDRPIWHFGRKAASFSTPFEITPERAFAKWPVKPGYPRAVCIGWGKPWPAAINIASRGFGKPKTVAGGSSAWWWRSSMSLVSSGGWARKR
jgi:TnpA family transposase